MLQHGQDSKENTTLHAVANQCCCLSWDTACGANVVILENTVEWLSTQINVEKLIESADKMTPDFSKHQAINQNISPIPPIKLWHSLQ